MGAQGTRLTGLRGHITLATGGILGQLADDPELYRCVVDTFAALIDGKSPKCGNHVHNVVDMMEVNGYIVSMRVLSKYPDSANGMVLLEEGGSESSQILLENPFSSQA